MHYEDDRFHPNNDDDNSVEEYEYNYVGNDARSETTRGSAANSMHKKNRKMLEDMKSIDKGYHTVDILVNGVKKPVDYYSTPMTPGAIIRDATTGARNQNRFVGSMDECLFFKVGYSGIGCKEGSLVLFYDSPEQYEKHMYTTVDAATKSKWVDNCMEIRKRYQ